MKYKIGLILLAGIICFLFYEYLFLEYQDISVPVVEESRSVYFLQYGAYSTYDNMVKATKKLSSYTYFNDEKYYYAFICITGNEKNLEKIKDFYKDSGYILYSKEINVTSSSFLISLDQYDLLLSETKELETIPTICSQGIERYEEEVKSEN